MFLRTRSLGTSAALSFLVAACNYESQFAELDGILKEEGNLVCNPFDGGGSGGGYLRARLYELDQNQPRQVTTLINNGQYLSDVVLSTLNIPTRAFDSGSPLQDGSLLLGHDGTALFEWFGLRIRAVTKVTAPAATVQQFAILSDDGVATKVKVPGSISSTDFIVNDGDHATQLGCFMNGQPAVLDLSTGAHEFHIDYYQGPRHHIANVLLYREVPAGDPLALNEPLCGTVGNTTWFDASGNPQATYLDLLARGWKVFDGYDRLDGRDNPCDE